MKKRTRYLLPALAGGSALLAGCQSVTAFFHGGGTVLFVVLLVVAVLYVAMRERRH